MDKISIIIPIHKHNINTLEEDLLISALNSVIRNTKTSDLQLSTYIVCPDELNKQLLSSEKYINISKTLPISFIINDSENTDFCSQINYAVKHTNEEWFSILEFDDMYTPSWFKSVKEYYYTREHVSLFLPINVQFEYETPNIRQFCNEIVWANEFSKDIGYVDFECLENFVGFNLTGGVFNKKDFIEVGGFKPSIDIAFNYEFLLRLTNKNLKVFVVPKEGYVHCLNREESLSNIYNKKYDTKMIQKWFELAKNEFTYVEDRQTKPKDKTIDLK